MPRTILPDARVTPRFAGICTFCRFPLLDAVPAENHPVDFALYGVPFDAGVTFRPGARFGPRAIREASQYIKPYSLEHDINIAEELSLADAGDSPIRPFALKETLDTVADFALTLGEESTRLFAVGGDHSIAYANMQATWFRHGQPAGGLPLIHFDSHLDTVDITGGEKWTHASPFRRAIESGFLNPRLMLSIGLKGPLNTARDLDFAREQGITLVTYEQWSDPSSGASARIDAFVEQLGATPVYVTFDIDMVDPAFAPGTGTPSIGGFTSAEALRLIRRLDGSKTPSSRKGLNVIGADVVEVLPDRDVSGITSLLASHVIFEILCLAALWKAGSRS